MSESPQAVQVRLFRTIVFISLVAAPLFAAFFVVLGLLAPEFPAPYMTANVLFIMLLTLASFWLDRRGSTFWAVMLYCSGLVVGMFYAAYFLNGLTGPMAVALMLPTVVAVLAGGSQAAWHISLLSAALYIFMAALEMTDLMQPRQLDQGMLHISQIGIFLPIFAIILGAVLTFARQTQRALDVARQRGQDLLRASQQAEQATEAEREAREYQERAALQLRQTVQTFTTFLERVTTGDYSALLDLDEVGTGEFAELLVLGRYLNETVETLVTTLRELQTVQQRYLLQEWRQFAETAQLGFKYQALEDKVQPSEEAWLDVMSKAVQNNDLIIEQGEFALPVALRDQVIGAIAVRREPTAEWGEDEMALASTIADQLAVTIEGLRLFEEAQSRAAREQLIGGVTARIRETLDIDSILQNAVQELGRALGLDEVVIQLVSEEQERPTSER